jgi:hypothetical protein
MLRQLGFLHDHDLNHRRGLRRDSQRIALGPRGRTAARGASLAGCGPTAGLAIALPDSGGRRATFDRGDPESAECFGRKRDRPFASLASYEYALRLDLVKKRPPLRPVEIPEFNFLTGRLSSHYRLEKLLETDWLVCHRSHGSHARPDEGRRDTVTSHSYFHLLWRRLQRSWNWCPPG